MRIAEVPRGPTLDLSEYGFTTEEFLVVVAENLERWMAHPDDLDPDTPEEDREPVSDNNLVMRPFKVWDAAIVNRKLVTVETVVDLALLVLFFQGRAETLYPRAFPKLPPAAMRWDESSKDYQMQHRFLLSTLTMLSAYFTAGPTVTVDMDGHPIFVWHENPSSDSVCLRSWLHISPLDVSQIHYMPKLRMLFDDEDLPSNDEYWAYMVGRVSSGLDRETKDS